MIEIRLTDANQWKAFIIPYKFALDKLTIMINHINQEAAALYDYNPIEHIKSRLKSPESILNKLERKGLPVTFQSVTNDLFDIVGIRIICSFVSDIYDLYELLRKRQDLKIVECKDYIRNPKPNGYQSLHLIVQIPVTLASETKQVYAEIQLRTMGMDFWASLEHKIFYKYNRDIPDRLKRELRDAADMTVKLDEKMKAISDEIGRIESPYAQLTNRAQLQT
ncbi:MULTISPECIES: GTP pyrophosphokinase family protein [unclassified Paenibacillus]|uniref:GTP pyrophosphokinase n=1 Tax=unclassified Paenibacillus TaxID=185978 RepID=UPI001C10032D|nr:MULTISPECIES: GTP pyrophosphokinase family protein [unclassified Paenibacillus]MBU5442173.1 GTP pyrophosphokinase family protein [Paenibacillus sp. MSJ-34]CAH0118918.1 GTP pyrophosphokinase YwaC [Paenibacillus sp. CECT 9249]